MYIYAAECWCDECGESIKKQILKELDKKASDFDDERAYDSDEFPKGPYDDNEASDGPEHCASREDCLNPTIIADEKYGHFFENDLTEAGIQNLKEMHENQRSEVTEFWVSHYRENGYQHEFSDTEEQDD